MDKSAQKRVLKLRLNQEIARSSVRELVMCLLWFNRYRRAIGDQKQDRGYINGCSKRIFSVGLDDTIELLAKAARERTHIRATMPALIIDTLPLLSSPNSVHSGGNSAWLGRPMQVKEEGGGEERGWSASHFVLRRP